MTMCSPARTAGGLVLAAVVLAATGCGGGQTTGSVSGTVTYNGKPVTSGDVNFISSTGTAALAKLDETGGYKIDALQAGEYKVYVTPPLPEPQAPGAKAGPPRKFEVPPKFRDATTSGVKVTVKGGSNDLPISLKD